jgi:hypothetical protein
MFRFARLPDRSLEACHVDRWVFTEHREGFTHNEHFILGIKKVDIRNTTLSKSFGFSVVLSLEISGR